MLSMSTLKDGPSRWLLRNLVLLAKDDCVELWEVWRYNSSFFCAPGGIRHTLRLLTDLFKASRSCLTEISSSFTSALSSHRHCTPVITPHSSPICPVDPAHSTAHGAVD